MSKPASSTPLLAATLLAAILALIVLASSPPACCGQLHAANLLQSAQAAPPGAHAMTFALTSTAFADGGSIPKQHTCDGADLSPALNWSGAPAATQSFALIADDPDAPAGAWTHWTLWDIPAKATSLPEGLPKSAEAADGIRQGTTSFRRTGYGGPCPPPGKPHRYFFKLYALDARLELKAGAGRDELERAMKGHILGQAQWMGSYGR